MRLFSNLCPGCRTLPIFGGPLGLSMPSRCPGCHTVFYRESGYFMGAMVLSYFAGSGLGILTLLILFAGFGVPIIEAAGVAVALVLMVTPLLYRFSRLAWIHLDHRADPQKRP